MNLLIVGATGFIGRELVKNAREKGVKVKGCGRSLWDEKIKVLFDKKDDYWCMENDEAPLNFFDNIVAIIILAAKRPYKDFGYGDYVENIKIVNDVIRLGVEHNIKNIIFTSSKAVYSGDGQPWSESYSGVPSSFYGLSKMACEELGLYYAKKNKFNFVSLRLAQVIGITEREGYLVRTIIDNAKTGRNIVLFGDGSQRRHYIYVKDVCRAILKAVGAKSGVYNIGMNTAISNYELASAINKAFGNFNKVILDGGKEMWGENDEMDVSKASEELKFIAKYDLDSMAKDIVCECNNESEK